jgi:hypothetical protein
MKTITKEDVARSIKFMVGKKLTIKQRKRFLYFWKTGNDIT